MRSIKHNGYVVHFVSLIIVVLALYAFTTNLFLSKKTGKKADLDVQAYEQTADKLYDLMNRIGNDSALTVGAHTDPSTTGLQWMVETVGGASRLIKITVFAILPNPQTNSPSSDRSLAESKVVTGYRYDDL